ncbi:MAG: transglycosylase SLT domain-containing protein [Sulfurimonas sp.]
MKQLIFLILLISSLFSQTLEEYTQEQQNAFMTYQKNQENNFKAYKQAYADTIKEYKKELTVFWKNSKLSTKTQWITYSKDKKTRSNVDFKNEMIIIQTIAASEEEAKQKLQQSLAKVVTVDTKYAQENDPLEKVLSLIQKPSNMVDKKVNPEPILSTIIFDKKTTKKSLRNYVKKHITKENIKTKHIKNKNFIIYSVSIKMPKNATIKRSKIYYNEIKKQARRQKLPIELIFAIMHSESSFNPRARSYVPAYGLMQLVPKTAGIDAYQYLYNKRRLVSGRYLYDSKNNIEMGVAYLHILYYKYLKKIKNPESRLYCTIAAYNTGAGNIAYAFTKTHNMNKAAPIINKLTPDEVYAKLLTDLRWDEPKRYLNNVSKRMIIYKNIYTM